MVVVWSSQQGFLVIGIEIHSNAAVTIFQWSVIKVLTMAHLQRYPTWTNRISKRSKASKERPSWPPLRPKSKSFSKSSTADLNSQWFLPKLWSDFWPSEMMDDGYSRNQTETMVHQCSSANHFDQKRVKGPKWMAINSSGRPWSTSIPLDPIDPACAHNWFQRVPSVAWKHFGVPEDRYIILLLLYNII